METANRIINEQEDIIAELKSKILETEDLRDIEQGKVIELQKAMRRIECSDDLDVCHRIARESSKIGV